jgi:hypothetical protein
VDGSHDPASARASPDRRPAGGRVRTGDAGDVRGSAPVGPSRPVGGHRPAGNGWTSARPGPRCRAGPPLDRWSPHGGRDGAVRVRRSPPGPGGHRIPFRRSASRAGDGGVPVCGPAARTGERRHRCCPERCCPERCGPGCGGPAPGNRRNRCTRRTWRTRRPWPPPHRGHGASPRRQRPGRAPDRGPVAAAPAPRSPQRAAGAPAASRGRLRTGSRGLDRPGRCGAGAAHPAHAAERPCTARPPSPCRRVRRQRLSDRMDACRASGARTSTGAAVRPRRAVRAAAPRCPLPRPRGCPWIGGPEVPVLSRDVGDARPAVMPAAPALASRCRARAGRSGVSCDSWGAMFFLVTAVPRRNTPNLRSLAHLVCVGLGFPYI